MADLVTIWVVTPHQIMDYDEWWGPCETDEDHDAALEYAQNRMCDLWDQYDSTDPRPVTVTMQQREVDREDFLLTQPPPPEPAAEPFSDEELDAWVEPPAAQGSEERHCIHDVPESKPCPECVAMDGPDWRAEVLAVAEETERLGDDLDARGDDGGADRAHALAARLRCATKGE